MNHEITPAGPQRRTTVLAIMVASLALLVAACGSSGRSTTSTTATGTVPQTIQSYLAYANCMRANGEPTFPDPVTGIGGIPYFPAQPPRGPALQAAQQACARLRPARGLDGVSPAQVASAMASLLKVSVCMRAHGITNFPDPFHTAHAMGWQDGNVDESTPEFAAAAKACNHGVAP